MRKYGFFVSFILLSVFVLFGFETNYSGGIIPHTDFEIIAKTKTLDYSVSVLSDEETSCKYILVEKGPSRNTAITPLLDENGKPNCEK